MTYGQLYQSFVDQNPGIAKSIFDYRPYNKPNSIRLELREGLGHVWAELNDNGQFNIGVIEEDTINQKMTEVQEKHWREIKDKDNEIEELKKELNIYIGIMDSQSKSIHLFNNIVRSYIQRDEMELLRKSKRR